MNGITTRITGVTYNDAQEFYMKIETKKKDFRRNA